MTGIPHNNKNDEFFNIEKLTKDELAKFEQAEKTAGENLIKRNDEIHSMANKLYNLQGESAGLLQECLKHYNISEKSLELIKAESFDIGIQEAKKSGVSNDDNLSNLLANLTEKMTEEDRISLLNHLAKANSLQTVGFDLEKARQNIENIDQCIRPTQSDDSKP